MCHGPGARLDLSERELILNRPGLVVAGDASASVLYQVLVNGRMPPRRPLNIDEIDVVKNWIDQGLD